MDMMTRSAVLAVFLVIVAAGAGAGWYFLGDRITGEAPLPADSGAFRDFDNREGSLRDEFGEPGRDSGPDGRITIVPGPGLDIPPPTGRPIVGLPDGPRFDWNQPSQSGSVFGSTSTEPMPRGTAAERVEADCRARGGGSYACRCLVRLARAALDPAEFEFLSLAEELEPRVDRLTTSGLELTQLPALNVRLVELDANAQRRCGSGLKPGR